ncbi:MAG: tripartite tricarboxylate transporter substrate binding protein [Burkholderiales bacterium]
MITGTRLMVVALLAVNAATANAQSWPSRPVKFIVTQSAGGSIDIAARTIGQKLAESFGQQFVIDNRAGANGMIGAELAAKSAPDGYTFLMTSPSALTINQHLYAKVPYDTARDFMPVTQTTSIAFLMVVNSNSPYRNAQEVIAAAKSKSEAIRYGSAGPGNQSHLAPEMLAQAAGVKFLHVPYKGEAPAIADLLGGQIDMIIGTMPALLPHVRSGKLRALAVCQPTRSNAVPDVPTMNEAGFPAVHVTGWTALVAPTGTSPEIIKRLRDEVVKVLALPDVREFLAKQGAEPVGSTPEQFGALIKSETVKWGAAGRAAGLKPE